MFAQTVSSSNYQVDGSFFGSGGDADISSTNYGSIGQLGEAFVGEDGSSESYESESGFSNIVETKITAADTTTTDDTSSSGGSSIASRSSITQLQKMEVLFVTGRTLTSMTLLTLQTSEYLFSSGNHLARPTRVLILITTDKSTLWILES